LKIFKFRKAKSKTSSTNFINQVDRLELLTVQVFIKKFKQKNNDKQRFNDVKPTIAVKIMAKSK